MNKKKKFQYIDSENRIWDCVLKRSAYPTIFDLELKVSRIKENPVVFSKYDLTRFYDINVRFGDNGENAMEMAEKRIEQLIEQEKTRKEIQNAIDNLLN